MTFLTTDLCDAHSESLQVASPLFKSYGGHPRFFGKVVTLKVFEDNSLVRTALSEPGEGKVLVVDGGGSLRCALVGDQIAALAVDNRWAGIIVYGCIRDSVAINRLPIGVRALNTHPLKSVKRGVGERDLTLHFADVRFHPNDYVYADEDGVIVSPSALW